MKLFLFFSLFIATVSNKFSIKVVHTPVYHSIPLCPFHNIIILQENDFENLNHEKNNFFAIDFSPSEDIGSPNIILKLLLGKNIQGKIRVFHFPKELYETFIREPLPDNPSPENFKNLKNIDPYLASIIQSWGSTFHIYNRNCRHFGNFLQRYYF
jgi:hypothetical protein